MTEWLTQEITQVQAVVQAGVVLLGICVVIATYARTKAIVPTLGALLFAGVVIWSVNNTAWFEDKIGEEFEGAAPAGAPVTVAETQVTG